MPKVSVVIPTYNRADYICEALDSVLSQTYKDYEIIVVDDGSTDNTQEVLSKYDGKIRYIYQENKGISGARNRGIKEAKGEFIAFLDSDDLWLPEKLEKSLGFINTYNFDWMCTASYRILELDRRGEKEKRYIEDGFLDETGRKLNLLKNGLFFFSSVPVYPGATLIRKHCFDKVSLFDETLRIGEDWDMFLRLEEFNLSAGYLNEPLFIYRVNKNSTTQLGKKMGLKGSIQVAQKHALILGIKQLLIRKSYAEFLWRCADLYFHSARYWDSFKCFLRSWYLYPEREKFEKMLRFIGRRIRKII